MIKRRMFGYLVALSAGCCAIAGCGSNGASVPTVDVSGVVTLDGAPCAGVTVCFTKGAEYQGVTNTDASGKYTVKAEVGDNKVSFTKEAGGRCR